MKALLPFSVRSRRLAPALPSLSQQRVPHMQGVTGFGSSIALVAVWVIAKNIGINAGEGCSNGRAAPAVQAMPRQLCSGAVHAPKVGTGLKARNSGINVHMTSKQAQVLWHLQQGVGPAVQQPGQAL